MEEARSIPQEIEDIEDYASAIVIIRNPNITIETKEEYYLVDRIQLQD